MSLNVSPELLSRAEAGPVTDEAFLACIEESLPYAWNVVANVARTVTGEVLEARDNTVPPSDDARGQLLRLMASDAMRGAIERSFGVTLAFQNCHCVAAFNSDRLDDTGYAGFTSPRGQLLNQAPELRNC